MQHTTRPGLLFRAGMALGCAVAVLLLLCAGGRAQETAEAWTKYFEWPFSATFKGESFSIAYPKEFTPAETTVGVFLESDAAGLSGQISTGLHRWRGPDAAAELLKKQGGNDVAVRTMAGRQVVRGTSTAGNDFCYTYIMPLGDAGESLYIQFRRRASTSVDYAPLLDRMVESIQAPAPAR